MPVQPPIKTDLAAAEKAFKAAQAEARRAGGGTSNAASALRNLGVIYHRRHEDMRAEEAFNQVLAINELVSGAEGSELVDDLRALGKLRYAQGRYADVGLLYKSTLAIDEKALGPEHHEVARDFNNLAELYRVQDRYAESDSLYKRLLTIYSGRDIQAVFYMEEPQAIKC